MGGENPLPTKITHFQLAKKNTSWLPTFKKGQFPFFQRYSYWNQITWKTPKKINLLWWVRLLLAINKIMNGEKGKLLHIELKNTKLFMMKKRTTITIILSNHNIRFALAEYIMHIKERFWASDSIHWKHEKRKGRQKGPQLILVFSYVKSLYTGHRQNMATCFEFFHHLPYDIQPKTKKDLVG